MLEPGAEVVQHADVAAGFEQQVDEVRADEARPAGNEAGRLSERFLSG